MITWRFPGREEPYVVAGDECAFCAVRGAAGMPLTLRAGGDLDGVLVFEGAAWACSRCAPLAYVKNWTALGVRAARVARSVGEHRLSPDDAMDVCRLVGEHVQAVGAG